MCLLVVVLFLVGAIAPSLPLLFFLPPFSLLCHRFAKVAMTVYADIVPALTIVLPLSLIHI